jgi:2-methylcitrate dehydratase PrpD
MVFKVYEDSELTTFDQQKYSMKYILAKIAQGGIETRLSYSVQVRRNAYFV